MAANVTAAPALDAPRDTGASALHVAVAEGRLGQIVRMLDETPELVHARDLRGQTPLHWAAKQGDLETVRTLCQYGASLTAQDNGREEGTDEITAALQDPEPRIPLDVAKTKEVELYLEAAGDARNRPFVVKLPDWTGAFHAQLQKLGKLYTTLANECDYLERAGPLKTVARFPLNDRLWRRLQRMTEGMLSSWCLAQTGYLINQTIKTGRLRELVTAFENSAQAKARIDALMHKLDHGRLVMERENEDQKLLLLKIKEEKLRQAEDRIALLEKELAELREDLTGTQQERDEALATVQQLRIENKRLQHAEYVQSSYKPIDKTAAIATEPVTGAANTAVVHDVAEQLAPKIDDSHLPKQLQVIRSIRRDRGFDVVVLSEQMKSTLSTLYKSLDSALKKLSEDIYSSSSRFVLELIQNADDNHYSDGCLPAFSLELNPAERFVQAYNNEIGFSEANVRSICEIGGSTKIDAARYIGRKGVGFKSVFKVTDQPHVFSNGYSFRFDSSKQLGHIVPEWIDATELARTDPTFSTICAEAFPGLLQGTLGGTMFYLPLRGEKDLQMEELIDDLAGAEHTLLFLRRLVSLDLTIDVKEKTKAHTQPGKWRTITRLLTARHEEIEQCIETRRLHNGEEIPPAVRMRYRVFRRVLDVPAHLIDRGRDGGSSSSTEITLAFPITDTPDEPIPQQMVFAFLPVRCVGFRFIVQGDFQLVTSRQDVHRTKPFNAWLRDQIAQLFVACVREDSYVRSRLNAFVPDESEVQDTFWRVLVDKLWALLETENCIPVESGRLLAPKQVLVKPLGFDNLISNDELLQYLDKEFLASSFDRTRALTKLRLTKFGPSDLIQCLRHPKMKLAERASSWFATLYAVLQHFDADAIEPSLLELATLPIFPLRTDDPVRTTVVSKASSKGSIFLRLPLALEQWQDNVLPPSVVQVLHPDAVTNHGEHFLHKMGITVPRIDELVEMFVLQHSSGLVHRLPKPLLAAAHHLRFVRDHLDDYLKLPNVSTKELQTLLFVPCTDGTLKRTNVVYFSSCSTLWTKLQKTHHVPTVDEDLLVNITAQPDTTPKADANEREKWRTFLVYLGVADAPRLSTSFVPSELLHSHSQRNDSHQLSTFDAATLQNMFAETSSVPANDGVFELVPSPELDIILDDGSRECVGLLVQLIDSAWERVPYKNCPLLWTKLRQLHAPTTLGDTRPFASCYSQALKTRFGDALPYLSWPVSHRAILDALSVTMDISPAVAVDMLELLSRERRGMPATWHALYSYLTDADASNMLTAFLGRLRAIDVVCVARPTLSTHHGNASDYLEPKKRLRWGGNNSIAESAGLVLLAEQGYSQWRDLMVQCFGIPVSLTIADYVLGFSQLTLDEKYTDQQPPYAPLGEFMMEHIPAEPLENQSNRRDFQQEPRWEMILTHYRNLDRLIETTTVSSDSEWVGIPLLLWRLGNETPAWYYWQINAPVPAYVDDDELVQMFADIEPIILHPVFTNNFPGLLSRLGSRPFSRLVSTTFVPQEKHGVYQNMASTLLYRRATSLAIGITMSACVWAIFAQEEWEPLIACDLLRSAEEDENLSEDMVALRSELLDLERRMLQFVHVYDVNKLLVSYSISTGEEIIEHEREKPFFYQAPSTKRFPRLFLSTQQRTEQNVLNFNALSSITGIPAERLERFFASQQIKALMITDIADNALRSAEEEREWHKLHNQVTKLTHELSSPTRRRDPSGPPGNGRRLGPFDRNQHKQRDDGQRFRGDHTAAARERNSIGNRPSYVIDRLLLDGISDAERDLANTIDWAQPGEEKSAGPARPGSGAHELDLHRPGNPRAPPEHKAIVEQRAFSESLALKDTIMQKERAQHTTGFGPTPSSSELTYVDQPFVHVNNETAAPLTSETLEMLEQQGLHPYKRETSDFPRKIYNGSQSVALHAPSSTGMLRELPPVSREHLHSIMNILGQLDTEHKCAYLRMEDIECNESFDQVIEELQPTTQLFTDAKNQLGLPTIIGRREAVDAYAPAEADVDDYISTQAIDHRVSQLAELFLFKLLSRLLDRDSFGPQNWVSRARERFFPELGPGNNRAGFDFQFVDHGGTIGKPGTTYCVEAKGQLSHTKKVVSMSANEWKVANDAANTPDSKIVYVLAIIALTPDPPVLLQWLQNPFSLVSRGWLDVSPDSYRIRVRVPWLHGMDGTHMPVLGE